MNDLIPNELVVKFCKLQYNIVKYVNDLIPNELVVK